VRLTNVELWLQFLKRGSRRTSARLCIEMRVTGWSSPRTRPRAFRLVGLGCWLEAGGLGRQAADDLGMRPTKACTARS
jgi:hypothetical protein